jgi:hypothetical protein
MARKMHISTQVSEETWEAVKDVGNLFGESISKAADRLIQRGLISLDRELGSSTPVYVRLARIEEELRLMESGEQRVANSYQRASKLGVYDKVKEIEGIGKELGIDIEKPEKLAK